MGGDAAPQPQGSRRPLRGLRLGARGLGSARRALQTRSAPLVQGAGEAPRRPRRDSDVHRRGPALPAARPPAPAGDSCRGVLPPRCLRQHVGSRPEARQDLFLLGGAGPAPRVPLAGDRVRRAYHRGLGVHRGRILPGERHRRHGRLDRLCQGAGDHRRALQPGPLQHLSLLCLRRRQLRERLRGCPRGSVRHRGGRVLHRLRGGLIRPVTAAGHRDRAAVRRAGRRRAARRAVTRSTISTMSGAPCDTSSPRRAGPRRPPHPEPLSLS